ncbi:MAG: AAA family ATPase [Marivibrio sp.]|uniref:ATP-dependent nuclease n=1 Tax=Marivibrio sp. TaxID=2039719 RepID=UPI0032EBB252
MIKNYRALRTADVTFHEGMNVMVGDNEAGKSTLLEAVNLALRGQLNRRAVQYELHPFLINADAAAEFIEAHRQGNPIPPPEISVEVFLADAPEVAELRGSNNSEKADACGIALTIGLDEAFQEEFASYVADPATLNSVPIEYYKVLWESFAGAPMSARSVPLKTALIDPSSISNSYAANKYVLEIVRDYLTKPQSVDLALAYRSMRDEFQSDARIKAINSDLAAKQGVVSDKVLSVAMDTTTRASWETGVLPHLDSIPLTLVGKGEQNSVKIKLAIEAAESCDVFLMEEPENHLSHTNLGRLVSHLADRCEGKQLIVSTHSSFVLNKLGIDRVMMFNGENAVTLDDLPDATKVFFQRLPGHDTLRLILAARSILVEGPSDELIVQKAYRQRHGCLPLAQGVEVISVGTSFKRFLDIARLLKLDVSVVRDNDGDPAGKRSLYDDYQAEETIRVYIDGDANARTLEPQLVKSNGLVKLNHMLGTTFATEIELSDHMKANKTDTALRLFEHADELMIPEYISGAIR